MEFDFFKEELELSIDGRVDTEKYDNDFQKIDFFKKYPQMYPFVGKNYYKNRMLIIGESHYLDRNSKFENTPANWYASNIIDLSSLEKKMTCIRRVVSNIHDGIIQKKWLKSRTIYKNINNALRESNKFVALINENYFSNLAVINGFVRPAEITGGSIGVKHQDIENAIDVINQIISIIKA